MSNRTEVTVCKLLAALVAVGFAVSVSMPAHAQQLQAGIHVQLPSVQYAEAMPAADRENALIITVTEDGSLYLGTEPVALEKLTRAIRLRRAADATSPVFVKADERAAYGDVEKVLAGLRSADIPRTSLLVAAKLAASGPVIPPAGLEVQLTEKPDAVPAQIIADAGTPAVVMEGQRVPLAELRSKLLPDEVLTLNGDAKMRIEDVAQAVSVLSSAGVRVILK